MIAALAFDMDGTIVDNMLFHQRAWIDFLGKYGIVLTPEAFRSQAHGTIEELIVQFFGKELTDERIRELGFEKEFMYRQMYQQELMELKGFSELLKEAKRRGIAIGLATMGNADNIDFVLDGLGVRSYFDVIAGGHHIKRGKPNPEIYELILRELKVPAAGTIAFEDTRAGAISARTAGLKVIGIRTTHSEAEFREWGFDETIPDFDAFRRRYF